MSNRILVTVRFPGISGVQTRTKIARVGGIWDEGAAEVEAEYVVLDMVDWEWEWEWLPDGSDAE